MSADEQTISSLLLLLLLRSDDPMSLFETRYYFDTLK